MVERADETLSTWDLHYATGQAVREWPCEELIRFVCQRDWPKKPRALELGCGNGRNLWFLVEQGFTVTGIDQSLAALDRAMHLLARRVALQGLSGWSVQKLSIAPGLSGLIGQAFDLVVDVQTLQHLAWPEREVAYKELARVLKPGGRFFSMCWLCGDQAAIYPDHPELTDDVAAFKAGYPQLAAAGFMVEHVNMTGRTYGMTHQAFWGLIEAVKR